eukprot:gene5645-8970_t
MWEGFAKITEQWAANFGGAVRTCNSLGVILVTAPADSLRFVNAACVDEMHELNQTAEGTAYQTLTIQPKFSTLQTLDCSVDIVDIRYAVDAKQFLGGDLTVVAPNTVYHEDKNPEFNAIGTPAEPGKSSRDYEWEEQYSKEGAGKCTTDCSCDGHRTCQNGRCKGIARCPGSDKSPAYVPISGFESAGFCKDSCDCKGERVCDHKDQCSQIDQDACSTNTECYEGSVCNTDVDYANCCYFVEGDDQSDVSNALDSAALRTDEKIREERAAAWRKER